MAPKIAFSGNLLEVNLGVFAQYTGSITIAIHLPESNTYALPADIVGQAHALM